MTTLVFTVHNVEANRESGFPSAARGGLVRALRAVAKEHFGEETQTLVSLVGDAPSGESSFEKAEGPVVVVLDMLGGDVGWGHLKLDQVAERIGKAAKAVVRHRDFTVSVRDTESSVHHGRFSTAAASPNAEPETKVATETR